MLLCFYTSQGIVMMTNVTTLTKHVLEIPLVRKFHLGSQFQRCQCVTLGSIDSGIGPRWERSSVTWEESIGHAIHLLTYKEQNMIWGLRSKCNLYDSHRGNNCFQEGPPSMFLEFRKMELSTGTKCSTYEFVGEILCSEPNWNHLRTNSAVITLSYIWMFLKDRAP